jgi:RNA polymerase sigma factor (sigma-70 family)
MSDVPDIELLQQFARNRSEAAFAELVQRHIGMVHSVALRHTSNPEQAQDITQAVFIILARKAGSLGSSVVLPGWLYHTARLTAANFQRAEMRRIRREQEAFMQSTLEEPASDTLWRELSPLLDDAMGRLRASDRDALVLRYLQNQSMAAVGATMGIAERAAQKRVNRALEKLRKFFMQRGVSSTTATIAQTITSHSVQTVPPGLATSVTAAAIAKSATISTTITTLVKGTIKIMTWSKYKLAAIGGASLILIAGVTGVAVSKFDDTRVLTPQDIIKQTQDSYDGLKSYSDNGTVVATVGGSKVTTTFNIRLQRPSFYRIDWTQTSGPMVTKGAVWSDGTGDFQVISAAGGEKNAKVQKMKGMGDALGAAAGVSSQASFTIPGIFFNQNWGDMLKSTGSTSVLQKDATVNGVDCYVLSGPMGTKKAQGSDVTVTFWIGKRDHLIHQTQLTMGKVPIPSARQLSDADIKKMLETQNQPATPEAIAKFRTNYELMLKENRKIMSSGPIVFIQTHDNIALNQTFSPSDFIR